MNHHHHEYLLSDHHDGVANTEHIRNNPQHNHAGHHHHGDLGSTVYHDHDGDIQHDHFVADAVLGATRIEKFGPAYHEHDE